GPGDGHQPPLAPGDGRPCGEQLHAGDRRQPHRARERVRRRRPEFLRPQLHQRRMGRSDRGVRGRGKRGAGRHARPCRRGQTPRQLGLLPRSPAAALRTHLRGHLSAPASPGAPWRYLIALGSNRRHPRYGRPARVLAAALARLAEEGVAIEAAAPVLTTDPIGPSLRRYANSAAVISTRLEPEALLALGKRLEREFGRRARGQRWTSRVLDLDLILWSGGAWSAPHLTVPH